MTTRLGDDPVKQQSRIEEQAEWTRRRSGSAGMFGCWRAAGVAGPSEVIDGLPGLRHGVMRTAGVLGRVAAADHSRGFQPTAENRKDWTPSRSDGRTGPRRCGSKFCLTSLSRLRRRAAERIEPFNVAPPTRVVLLTELGQTQMTGSHHEPVTRHALHRAYDGK